MTDIEQDILEARVAEQELLILELLKDLEYIYILEKRVSESVPLIMSGRSEELHTIVRSVNYFKGKIERLQRKLNETQARKKVYEQYKNSGTVGDYPTRQQRED